MQRLLCRMDWLDTALNSRSKGEIGFQHSPPIIFSFLWIPTICFIYQCYGNVFQECLMVFTAKKPK